MKENSLNIIIIIKDAVKAWPKHEMATRKQTKTLRKGYVKARIWLGDKYLLAKPIERREIP